MLRSTDGSIHFYEESGAASLQLLNVIRPLALVKERLSRSIGPQDYEEAFGSMLWTHVAIMPKMVRTTASVCGPVIDCHTQKVFGLRFQGNCLRYICEATFVKPHTHKNPRVAAESVLRNFFFRRDLLNGIDRHHPGIAYLPAGYAAFATIAGFKFTQPLKHKRPLTTY
jgi:hypothetical protein